MPVVLNNPYLECEQVCQHLVYHIFLLSLCYHDLADPLLVIFVLDVK